MQYKAYIFDYDYTLAFSETAILMCFRHTFKALGYEGISDEDTVKTIGMSLRAAFSQLAGVSDEEKLDEMLRVFHAKADEVMTPFTTLYPSVIPMLGQIRRRGALIGIVSNKLRFRISEIFKRYEIEAYLDALIGSEDFKEYKPNPEGLFMAMERLGVSKSETLFVGDSIIDSLTAKNAGVDFIGVTTGTTTAEDFMAEPHVKIIRDLSLLFD